MSELLTLYELMSIEIDGLKTTRLSPHYISKHHATFLAHDYTQLLMEFNETVVSNRTKTFHRNALSGATLSAQNQIFIHRCGRIIYLIHILPKVGSEEYSLESKSFK